MEMTKLAAQFAAAVTPSATALIRLGNISPSRTHMNGPHVAAKKRTKTLAAMSATTPQAPGSPTTSSPAASVVTTACENATAMVPSPIVMPAEPMSSGMRRPTRSTISMPMIVPAMLSNVVITWIRKDWSSGIPTDCHSVFE